MAEILSPGVVIEEIDASTIVPTVSNSISVFCGNFDKGPVGIYKLITSVQELISFYGYPTNTNYNDWYQAYNFLQYGNKLLVSRAANISGTATVVAGMTVTADVTSGTTVAITGVTSNISVGDAVAFEDSTSGGADLTYVYEVVSIVADTSLELDRAVEATIDGDTYSEIFTVQRAMNGTFDAADDANDTATVVGASVVTADEAVSQTVIEMSDTSGLLVGDRVCFEDPTSGGADLTYVYDVEGIVADVSITLDRGLEQNIDVTSTYDNVFLVTADESTDSDSDYVGILESIENATDFETKEASLAFADVTNSKLRIIARNPGSWSSDLEIAIAKPSAFNQTVPASAFNGIALDDLYEYAPSGTEIGLIIKLDDTIVETWTVDFDSTAKDHNNKSTYIEDVINSRSEYIFVKDNTANTSDIKDYLYSSGSTISLLYGSDATITNSNISDAYDLFSNKEEIDIDIVIANELDYGVSAKNLADTRKDCLAFIGAPYAAVVGQKSATATSNLIDWRKGTGSYTTSNVNYNNMFVIVSGNYKYQYDRYNDKYRWVNIAGDIGGLRAQTSMNRASWWASAGLERGQVKNSTKLAFNPTQGQRDLLYKNSINPVVSFPGQGTVMWGQKTLLAAPSSFDRANVRGLFNTMERALGKMAKFQVMEFNDNFTRNRIVSMIKPYLSSVQAGRGIQDFLVICDESNNTADIISRNQLIVDIYIKPNYVSEFIILRFTNAGTNSFSEVIGG